MQVQNEDRGQCPWAEPVEGALQGGGSACVVASGASWILSTASHNIHRHKNLKLESSGDKKLMSDEGTFELGRNERGRGWETRTHRLDYPLKCLRSWKKGS